MPNGIKRSLDNEDDSIVQLVKKRKIKKKWLDQLNKVLKNSVVSRAILESVSFQDGPDFLSILRYS